MACFILLYCFVSYLNFSHVTKLKRNHIILLNHVRSSSIRFSNFNWQIRRSLVRIAVRVTRRSPIGSAFSFCSENGPSANDSFNSSSSSCAPSESEVYFVYQDRPEAPPEDEPSAPAVIARLPSPICLTQPKLFHPDSRYASKRVKKYLWYYSYGSNVDSATCAEHQLQSVFAFNVSALNPGTIIVGVVTNDSRITKCVQCSNHFRVPHHCSMYSVPDVHSYMLAYIHLTCVP